MLKKENVLNEEGIDEEYVLAIPDLKPDWNEGRIQIVINRCAECIKHKSTTSHEEAVNLNYYIFVLFKKGLLCEI